MRAAGDHQEEENAVDDAEFFEGVGGEKIFLKSNENLPILEVKNKLDLDYDDFCDIGFEWTAL